MNRQKITYLALGVAIGFAAGFAFTNSVNRREHDALRAEVSRLRAGESAPQRGNAADPSQQGLSDEELRRKIAQADANPQDTAYQRELGRALFLYATNFDNPALLPDVLRLLRRAHEANPTDYDVTVLVGNTYFLMGQSGDSARFSDARAFYQKAAEAKPGDVYPHTALGLTYFYDRPSDPRRAITEYRKSLAIEPRHEMTLQSLAAALLAAGELKEAQKRVDELQQVNPSNAALPDLRAQLSQRLNAASDTKGGR